MRLDGSRAIENLLITNSWQMNMSRCYRESVDGKIPRWIKKLSRIYWPDRNFLNGLRIYREDIETNSRKLWWIEDAIRSVEKSSPRVLIDGYLLRPVEKLLSLIKSIFQRREKHINECNQASYSTKDPNNILSSQKHLSTRKT